MSNRSQDLVSLRPMIETATISIEMSLGERFQNTSLRPILKFQNDLLLSAFKNYISKRKDVFYELSVPKRLEYIAHALKKDIKLRNSVKGMIIGQFTLEEYETYIQDSSALNKRMMNMVVKRLQDQIQFFEQSLSA